MMKLQKVGLHLKKVSLLVITNNRTSSFGRFNKQYKGIVGAPKIKRFVEDINQPKLTRWQYEKLLAENGRIEGLFRYETERARLLTLFEEDKEPFFSPKLSKDIFSL
jgi:hypothetical protein